MRFDTKIAIVVRGGLAGWQQLNVTAFLASGIAAACGDTIGKPYEDGSGHRYLEMFRQPVLVYTADGPGLGLVRERPPPGRCRRHLYRRHVRHRARRGQPGRGPGGGRR